MKILCLCHTCAMRHTMDFDLVAGVGDGFSDWITKHPPPHHDTEFRWPQRSFKVEGRRTVPLSRTERDRMARRCRLIPKIRAHGRQWLDFLENADVKTAYGASSAPTLTLASLAASSTLLAGRESTAVDNGASNKYLDVLVAGHFKTAASNAQAGSISIAVVAAEDDTPNWSDVFDGTDSTETVSLQSVYDQICKVGASISTTSSNALVWPFGMFSVAGLFGGNVPDQFVFFVSHNAETSTNAWSATEGDHAVKMTPVYLTVI